MSLYTTIWNNARPHELKSLKLIARLLQEHGTQHLGFSFNGGKDCTVLLHLIRAAVQHLMPLEEVVVTGDECPRSPRPGALRDFDVLYFEESEEFPEMEEFMKLISARYSTKIHRLRGRIKPALTEFLEPRGIRAIFLGQRRVDPDSKHIPEIAPSDRGYPKFDRVNPILDWTHSDVWRFLITYKLEYCPIYDLGYTSAGPQSRTLKNPALVVNCEEQTYLPAYSLPDGRMERYGRPWGRRKLESSHNGVATRTAAIVVCTPAPFSPHGDDGTAEDGVSNSCATNGVSNGTSSADSASFVASSGPDERKEIVEPCGAHHHCHVESLTRQLSSLGVSVKHLVYLRLSVSHCCLTSINDATHTNLVDERDMDICKHASEYASLSDSGSHSPSRTSSSRSSLTPLDLRKNTSPSPSTHASEFQSTRIIEEPTTSIKLSHSSTSDTINGFCANPLLSRTRAPCPDSSHTFRSTLEKELDTTCLCKAFEGIQKRASALSQSHDYVYVCGEPVPEPRPTS